MKAKYIILAAGFLCTGLAFAADEMPANDVKPEDKNAQMEKCLELPKAEQEPCLVAIAGKPEQPANPEAALEAAPEAE
jgi:uncharacterized membrane protein